MHRFDPLTRLCHHTSRGRVDCHAASTAFIYHYGLDGICSLHGKRLVHGGFQMVDFAAAVLLIRRYDSHCAGIEDALMQAFGGEAAEYH